MSRKSSSVQRAPTTATQRLKQDYLRLKKDPIPYVTAEPLPSNILEWHYLVLGPNDTPYFGGIYHGKLVFPREFPFRPPSIYMITPSGRFKCNTRLCLSISDFHPDTWNPAWSVGTILTGLLSFMVEDSATLGSIETSHYTKRQLALQSGPFNLKDSVFCELFPGVAKEIRASMNAQTTSQTTNANVRNEQQSNAANERERDNQSNLVNLVIVAGVALFALAVNSVIQSL
uniref:ubiquitin-conjugating enzyme E2 J2-like n=1 Tax=Styela clava TaxID=7725 RepID=UPI001939C878|nr:ubiquitin-conjugating enzyme E2 J2-like [Styela clava]